ncbi:MAG TPA: hypothetical protein VI341_01395 [Actinomycetota bacterium]
MNCLVVRDRLAERSLGVLPNREATPIDRHLVWCAACRKEAAQLDSAAAMLAFSVAPAEAGPSPELEDRVVEAIQGQAAGGAGRHVAPRRGRLLAAALVAAVLAVSGLGWGAVMAGKAAKSDEAAEAAQARQKTAVDEFRTLLQSLEFSDPEGEVLLGTLIHTRRGGGSGSAFTLVSPSIDDMAIVLVTGVPVHERSATPFTVELLSSRRESLSVGTIDALDDAGSGIVVGDHFAQPLGTYDQVVVRDVDGQVVMRGEISARAPIASPGP